MLRALNQGVLTRVCQLCQVSWCYGRAPRDWQTGVVILIHKKGDRSECTNYRGIFLLSLPGKVYAKCLQKRCYEIIELQLDNAQCGFRPGRSTAYQIFTLQQILRNLGSVPKTFAHVLLSLRKHTTGFLVESFGKCCGSTVSTAACYWPSIHCTCLPAQKFVSVSGELNHNRSQFVLDSDKGVCCHHSPS